jgi:hypothetical protein
MTTTRATIDEIITQYTESLDSIKEGEATPAEQEELLRILERLSFYTTRYMVFNSK